MPVTFLPRGVGEERDSTLLGIDSHLQVGTAAENENTWRMERRKVEMRRRVFLTRDSKSGELLVLLLLLLFLKTRVLSEIISEPHLGEILLDILLLLEELISEVKDVVEEVEREKEEELEGLILVVLRQLLLLLLRDI